MLAAFSCLEDGTALAGAWPIEPGRAQVIAKYERTTADQGYDPDANRVMIGTILGSIHVSDRALGEAAGQNQQIPVARRRGLAHGVELFVQLEDLFQQTRRHLLRRPYQVGQRTP